MSRKLSALVCAALCLSTPAFAHHVSVGGGPSTSGPIITMSATTMPQGKWSAGFSSEYIKSRRFTDAQLTEMAGQHIHAHSADFMLTNTLSASYGITNDLMLSASVPYIYRENIRSGAHSHVGGLTLNGVDYHGDSGGVGDVTVMGTYRFYTRELQAALLFGVKMPTGEKGKQHLGEKLEAEHQPGSGSWDPSLGLALSKEWNGLSFGASMVYTWGFEGSQDTDLGDRAHYGIAVSKRIGGELHDHGHGEIHQHKALDLVLELNGEWYGEQQTLDDGDEDGGGTELFLSPGIRYSPGNNWSGYVSVGVPVRQDLRRGHPDTNFKVMLGISKAF